MDLQLHNKLALVTASSGGIGLAIAETLAAEGGIVRHFYKQHNIAATDLTSGRGAGRCACNDHHPHNWPQPSC